MPESVGTPAFWLGLYLQLPEGVEARPVVTSIVASSKKTKL